MRYTRSFGKLPHQTYTIKHHGRHQGRSVIKQKVTLNLIRWLQKDIKQEVTRRMLHGEIQIENVQLDKFKDISNNFELWTSFREKLLSK